MTDAYRDLHGDAWSEWRDEATKQFVQEQRRAFLAGFEAAADESEQFNLLRQWLEEQRDEAKERYDEHEEHSDFVQYHAYRDVLVKLSEMGCRPND